jgi:hypothetical protein
MTPNPYLWPQLSGPIAQAIVTGIQNAFQEPLPLIQYWSTLSILTAQDVDGTLNYVGALSGYPRPLVGDIFYNAFLLILADALLPPVNSTTYGLSDAATWPSGPGGQLDTALPISTNVMPATWYQQMLPIVAFAEYYGLSLQVVDILAAWANTNGGGTGYTIIRDQYNNIVVVFTSYTDPRTLYIANLVVGALETLPLVVFEEP